MIFFGTPLGSFCQECFHPVIDVEKGHLYQSRMGTLFRYVRVVLGAVLCGGYIVYLAVVSHPTAASELPLFKIAMGAFMSLRRSPCSAGVSFTLGIQSPWNGQDF
jgi:hypothetical protein